MDTQPIINQPKIDEEGSQNEAKKRGIPKDAERHEFIRFIALNRMDRQKEFGYDEQGDFAREKMVNQATLSKWKNDPEFWKEVMNHWKKWGMGKTPDVMAGLYRKAATEGNASEAMAWMKIMHDWQDKSIQITESEDLKAIAESFRKIANKRYDEPSGDVGNERPSENNVQEQ